MPSILSGCLVLLKIAMAVNDGLHSMLSSIYSIIENVLNSDQAMEPIQDSDSAQVLHCSKSRILEAFNRRRANIPIFEQTEVYVTNMNPYQEITITNKDYDGKRKRSSSVAKKSQTKDVKNHPNDFRSNEEICSSCPGTSQSNSPSLVSSDTGNESEYQSCKTLNGSVELEENICVKDEPGNMNTTLETSNEEETSTEQETSMEADQSPNSSFLEVLQSKIKLTSQTLQKALSNVTNPPTKNVYGLKDLESIEIQESSSADKTNSPPEISDCRKQLLEETARLYENFLLNYYHKSNDTKLRVTKNERGLKSSAEECISDGNEPAFEDCSSSKLNCLPISSPAPSPWQVNESQQKQNPLPTIIISDHSSCQTDSDCRGVTNSSDTESVSKTPATKRFNSYLLPLSLQKDKWIKVGSFEQSKNKDSKTLHQSKQLLERNVSIPGEKFDVCQSLVRDDTCSSDESNNISGAAHAFDWQLDFLDLSNLPFNVKNFSFSDESDISSLERIDLMKKILQDVGAVEVLEQSNADEHQPQRCTSDFFSKAKNSYPEKYALEESKIVSVPPQTDLLDVDHIPLMELDTEDKQITYLNYLTENYRKCLQIFPFNQKYEYLEQKENELLGNLEKRHKMIDTISNGYTNQLDSITRNAGVCRNELCSIDTDLKTIVGVSNFKQEASNSANCLQIISPQTSTSVTENHAPRLPVFLKNSSSEPLEVIENEKMSATFSKNENNCLIGTEINSKTTFTEDGTHTETSTPIKGRKIDDPSWVSTNLSSGSREENIVNECKDIISSMYYSKRRRNILFYDRELALLDSKQEIEPSENVKEISLEAEDWKKLASQMSKNYEDVVSLLNSMDDSESMKKESYSAEEEDCNIDTGVVVTEEVLKCDRVSKALVEQSTNEQSNKELEEATIPCSERKFNNANATITDGKIINKDLFMCLQKENFATEDKMLEDQTKLDNYLESYVNSTESNMEETKLQLQKFLDDEYEKRSKFLSMKSNSSSSTEDNFSDEGKSTPISNMEDLIKREELETIQIYDDFQVCDKVEENYLISGDLSEDDQ